MRPITAKQQELDERDVTKALCSLPTSQKHSILAEKAFNREKTTAELYRIEHEKAQGD